MTNWWLRWVGVYFIESWECKERKRFVSYVTLIFAGYRSDYLIACCTLRGMILPTAFSHIGWLVKNVVMNVQILLVLVRTVSSYLVGSPIN